MTDYNPMELMICVAARLLEDGKTVGVGTGAPCAAAMLAQKTHAPDLFVVFEAGGLAPLLPSMPISVGDSPFDRIDSPDSGIEVVPSFTEHISAARSFDEQGHTVGVAVEFSPRLEDSSSTFVDDNPELRLLDRIGLTSTAAGDDDSTQAEPARSWRALGPHGGSIGCLAVSPLDPQLVVAGLHGWHGAYRSTNGGTTWEPIFDDQAVQSIGAIAINQSNPDVIWVGTGEGSPRNSVNHGNGVYRSIDGGETWMHLGLSESRAIHRCPRRPARYRAESRSPAWHWRDGG